MYLLNSTAAGAAELSDELRLSSVIRSFFEWFFTPSEVELYAPWLDLLTVIGTLGLAAWFLVLLFSPLFCGRRRAKK